VLSITGSDKRTADSVTPAAAHPSLSCKLVPSELVLNASIVIGRLGVAMYGILDRFGLRIM